jgi:hypothetical protein
MAESHVVVHDTGAGASTTARSGSVRLTDSVL